MLLTHVSTTRGFTHPTGVDFCTRRTAHPIPRSILHTDIPCSFTACLHRTSPDTAAAILRIRLRGSSNARSPCFLCAFVNNISSPFVVVPPRRSIDNTGVWLCRVHSFARNDIMKEKYGAVLKLYTCEIIQIYNNIDTLFWRIIENCFCF